jgi:hypothetical protein
MNTDEHGFPKDIARPLLFFRISGDMSAADLRLVTFRRQQDVQFSRIAQFDFEKPAARVSGSVFARAGLSTTALLVSRIWPLTGE